MTMPNQAVTPTRQLDTLHGDKECVSLCFDGLGQKAARAAPQNGRERIVA